MTTPSGSGELRRFNADEAYERLIHHPRTPHFSAGGGTSLSLGRLANMANISANMANISTSDTNINSASPLVVRHYNTSDGHMSAADFPATLITKATFASLIVNTSAQSISEGIDIHAKVNDLLGNNSHLIATATDATDSVIAFGRSSGKLIIPTATAIAEDGTFNLLGADAISTPTSEDIMLAYNQRDSVGGVALLSAGSNHNPHDMIAEKAVQLAEAAFADILADISTIQLRAINDFYDTSIAPALHQMQDAAQAAIAKAKEGAVDANMTSEQEMNYTTCITELASLADYLHKFEANLQLLEKKEYDLQQQDMNQWTTTDALTDITSATDDASFYEVDADIANKMATIVARVTTIKKSVSDVLGRIRTVLVTFCNIPEKVRAESAIAQIVIKLPSQLNGKPNPLVAEELKSIVLKIIATYPEQLWAIIPALTRTLADSHLTQPWETPKLRDGYAGIPDSLIPYFAAHNKRLFVILENIGRDSVQRALASFSTGDDDQTRKRTSQADRNDGCGVVVTLLHYHEQSGYQTRSEIISFMAFAHGAFVEGSPVLAVAKIRIKLVQAQRLKIKLEYEQTVRRMEEVLRRRDPAFLVVMGRWMSCPDPTQENDCVNLIDQFLAEVERVARNIVDIGNNLNDAASSQAAAMFTQFSKSVGDAADEPAKKDTATGEQAPVKKYGCPVKGCSQSVPPQLANNSKLSYKPTCGMHFQQMCKGASLTFDDGKEHSLPSFMIRKPSGGVNGWKKTGVMSANVADAEKKETDMEAKLNQMLDERMSKLADGISTQVSAMESETEPEPEPEADSFAAIIAQAIANRDHK